MRFVSLFLVFSLTLCYSDICSATVLIADNTDPIASHCDMVDHAAADSSDESQVFIQNLDTTDLENSECCYEGLTTSSVEDNSTYKSFELLYLLDLPISLEINNSKNIDLINSSSSHDPPSIYLSVSSFLL